MNCPNCKREPIPNKEMCAYCGAPLVPIPIPPNGKIKFGKYD